MLRILIICFFLYSCNSAIKTFEFVAYDQSVMPACAIKLTDKYWQWRYAQNGSSDVREETSKLYALYLRLIKSSEGGNNISNEKLMCNRLLLMSPELAKVMNAFGKNASPMSFYYDFILKVDSYNYNKKILTENEFEDFVFYSVKNIELKFKTDKHE